MRNVLLGKYTYSEVMSPRHILMACRWACHG